MEQFDYYGNDLGSTMDTVALFKQILEGRTILLVGKWEDGICLELNDGVRVELPVKPDTAFNVRTPKLSSEVQ